ncbi:putative late L1 protein [Rhinolophus ferrumequinum papillomavirus 1]|uniref:Major capsid protein L1 n=1 Tax=Rhinolophus ferrumequinum papillomavirus 1 TaxID=1464074 RepID=W8E8N2_9PAPI|nr:putative late L1 protein [Rhinolophus ferrumequinum papillomavirus 1]AHJ81407.1 putative late L1 protein [Rhinolophus ferrumequinum papillomavirus 1]
MAVWLPATNKFYLPPQPITRVLHSDEYVTRTNIFYHAGTERLLTVGHPFYDVKKGGNVVVPKVSSNQYRVFRIQFPDPNNFAFGDKQIFDPEKERLVWAVRGVEIHRGQPLGIGVTGHPYFNRLSDVENSFNYNNSHAEDTDARANLGFDPKQTQLFMLGCKPQSGEHWGKAKACDDPAPEAGDCPPLELVDSIIQDGDMCDIGMGAMDFAELNENRSDVPLDIANSICKYPDFVKMAEEPFGDSLFFYARREQLYARHTLSRDGVNKEAVPNDLMIKPKTGDPHDPVATDNYFITPSGSLVSSEAQLFNRPYWLQRAQGQNNGILWMNEMFLTVLDNTRGTVMSLSVSADGQTVTEYTGKKFNEYLRHVEEFQLSFIVQLCKVQLTPENLAFIHTMNPEVIDKWHLAVNPPPGSVIEDTYRYIRSLATKCPDAVPPTEPPDPYKDMKFWVIDLTDRMTEQLDQTPLGRKFLFQTGSLGHIGRVLTRSSSTRSLTTTRRTKAVKRKRRS